MPHKAGDKMYVDFVGSKATTTDPVTGELTEYEGKLSVSYIL